jgi:hypothetical protein
VTPEELAAIEAAQEKQLRDLATQMAQMTKLGFDPMTIRKGIITAVAGTTSPPTVSINISGDTNTTVSQVRTLNNYTPVVGQTVLVAKQGAEIFLIGSIASINPKSSTDATLTGNGWIRATLTNGTHGSGEHAVHYRRVLDHGSWKMQWRGMWNTSGSATMIGSANALGTSYRPTSYRQIACARESDGAVTIRMDFNADGTVTVLTGTPGISSTSVGTSSHTGHSHGYIDDPAGTEDSTYVSGSHSHTVNDHSHGGLVVIDYPTWISLNGVEYFL